MAQGYTYLNKRVLRGHSGVVIIMKMCLEVWSKKILAEGICYKSIVNMTLLKIYVVCCQKDVVGKKKKKFVIRMDVIRINCLYMYKWSLFISLGLWPVVW